LVCYSRGVPIICWNRLYAPNSSNERI